MPKKIDPLVKERCVRQVLEHLAEYPTLTVAAEAVARMMSPVEFEQAHYATLNREPRPV